MSALSAELAAAAALEVGPPTLADQLALAQAQAGALASQVTALRMFAGAVMARVGLLPLDVDVADLSKEECLLMARTFGLVARGGPPYLTPAGMAVLAEARFVHIAGNA